MMNKLFIWAWALVPESAKMWVIVVGIAIILGLLGFSVYKIDKNGYDRCEAKYSEAVIELKDNSRKEIIKTGKHYEKIRNKIHAVEGTNDIVGPRVGFAIDSLPQPVGGGK